MQSKFTLKIMLSCIVLFLVVAAHAADTPGITATEPKGIRSVKVANGYMVPYKVKLSDEVSFEMIPIPGGKFKLGSPATEKNRNADEGPQVEVQIEPFWMGKCEVTWGEYKIYMDYYEIFKNSKDKRAVAITEKNRLDAVTAPTPLHEPSFTYEWGDDPRLPAVTVSHFAARQYSKWLSKLTGQTFRLPNEAEWEYACRAGTTTAYSFGDDPKLLGEYAWTAENSKEKTHFVGTKKPNPWGLYDLHGNVLEWTLDAYTKTGYKHLVKPRGPGLALTNWPDVAFPRALRGGTFEFDPEWARSAARYPSDDAKWYDTDPNRPKSPWWLTDDPARGVGLRVIRPLKQPTSDDLDKSWEIDNELTKELVEGKFDAGKGARGVVIPLAAPQSDKP